MKVIIAGSRDIIEYDVVLDAIAEAGFNVTEVVSGAARGVDRLGEQFARDCGLSIKLFPANWDKHGRAAGHIRNAEMAQYADALIAVWDGISPGTKNMVNEARKRGLKVYMKTVDT